MTLDINIQPSCCDDVEAGAIRVDQAVTQLLAKTKSVTGFQCIPLRETLNRVLFEDIQSPIDVPAHDNSAMDGYALAHTDLPEDKAQAFKVAGTAFAGKPFDGSCQQGECIRIMTGAMLPAGTDSVVIQEQVNVTDNASVEIGTGHRKNQNVRFAGEDIKTGSTVLPKGHRVKAADLGVLASLGVNEIKVYRKPRVSFFSTGDELKSIGEALRKGDIYDSNRYSLFGLLSDCHVDLIDLGVVVDDPEKLRETLLTAADCSDMVLTSGGVSVGEADFIKDVLQQIGLMDFWKILMKPGRPLTVGTIGESLFLGLPGNPVAVMVTFHQFVKPSLQKLAGLNVQKPRLFKAHCVDNIRKNKGRCEFQRAIASNDEAGNLQVKLTGSQGSGVLTSMSRANCFIVLNEDRGSVAAGDEVTVQFFYL